MYLLDSNICIAYMKNELEVRSVIRQLPIDKLRLPSIVVAELSFGAWNSELVGRNLERLAQLRKTFPVVPFDEDCALQYGRIRAELQQAGTTIGPNDTLIAATALSHSAVLITRNVKEFSRVRDLHLLKL